MTQTGGLVILLARALFGVILAVLAYVLLRHEKDLLDDVGAPTAGHFGAARRRSRAPREEPRSSAPG